MKKDTQKDIKLCRIRLEASKIIGPRVYNQICELYEKKFYWIDLTEEEKEMYVDAHFKIIEYSHNPKAKYQFLQFQSVFVFPPLLWSQNRLKKIRNANGALRPYLVTTDFNVKNEKLYTHIGSPTGEI